MTRNRHTTATLLLLALAVGCSSERRIAQDGSGQDAARDAASDAAKPDAPQGDGRVTDSLVFDEAVSDQAAPDLSCGLCSTDKICCGGVCVNPFTDKAHCGGCGKTCPGDTPMYECLGGTCECSFPPPPDVPCPVLDCGSYWADSYYDPDNCGECGKVCPAGKRYCDGGECESCASHNKAECDGACIDVGSDVDNCGACDNKCATNEACIDGDCVSSAGNCPAGCPTNQICCGNSCVDPFSDKAHCGGCDKVCPENPIFDCFGGTCECFVPPPPECGIADCGTYWADTDFDPDNCGDCEKPCPTGKRYCDMGVCESCASHGLTECSNTCLDVNGTDINNCGGCDVNCGVNQVCLNGDCIP